MKTHVIVTFLMFCITSVYTQTTMKDISLENYPRVDGSTSTFPLNKIIACKLLNIEYEWDTEPVGTFWSPNTKYEFWLHLSDSIKQTMPFNNGKLKASQTHQAFINLIENKADIILSARKMSKDEKKHADSLRISLIETPIALDALIFLSNEKRGVKSLTTQQIQDIYMGKIDRWETVGGDTATLYPLIRDANSGSQELFESIAMQRMKMPCNEKQIMERIVWGMPEVFMALGMEQPQAICFSVFYYKEMMIRNLYLDIQTFAINGIEPNRKTIADKTYPYVAEVYAIIRSDLPKNGLAYQLYEWLQSEEGQTVIIESGYVPINNQFKKGD
jgi:phosphate transport system substrate-binding protein